MKKERRKFSAAFKTKVVLEALKERETLQQLASKFELNPNQICIWRKEFLDNAQSLFGDKRSGQLEDTAKEKETLYGKIGQLQVEVDFLKKVLGK